MNPTRNECVTRVMDELERYGIKGEIIERSKHLEIAWDTPAGHRFVITSKTPSDWRASLNIRSDVRRLLKADNLQPKQISELSFQKAMSLPKQNILKHEEILQRDVDALSDLMLELQNEISSLKQKMNNMVVVSKVESRVEFRDNEIAETKLIEEIERVVIPAFMRKHTDEEIGPFRKSSRQHKVIAGLSYQFEQLHDIIERNKHIMSAKYVMNTLSKAKKLGFVERGLTKQWRRIPR